jgi:small-conductance mechanosensitive channel
LGQDIFSEIDHTIIQLEESLNLFESNNLTLKNSLNQKEALLINSEESLNLIKESLTKISEQYNMLGNQYSVLERKYKILKLSLIIGLPVTAIMAGILTAVIIK